MNTIYKLTDQDMKTFRGFQWKLNEQTPELPAGGELCSENFYHAYTNPLLAVFLNPIHCNFKNPMLFKGTGFGESANDYGLKVGYKSMVLEEELTIQEVTTVNRVAFGILCALEVCKDEHFKTWAERWLNGTDRTEESAEAMVAKLTQESYWVAVEVVLLVRRGSAGSAAARCVEWASPLAAKAASAADLDLIALAEIAMTIK